VHFVIPLLDSGGKKLYHIDFCPVFLRNFFQIMLMKILLEVNSQIRIRDISAFLMRSGQEDAPETPYISIVSVFFAIIFRF
jgi:hypothetical protein